MVDAWKILDGRYPSFAHYVMLMIYDSLVKKKEKEKKPEAWKRHSNIQKTEFLATLAVPLIQHLGSTLPPFVLEY